MSEISQELAQRMADLIRELHADHVKYGAVDIEQDFVARTAALVDELPAPTDPDLIEAREIVKATLAPENHSRCNCRDKIDAGEWDDGHKVRASLAAIKRGRDLERAAK